MQTSVNLRNDPASSLLAETGYKSEYLCIETAEDARQLFGPVSSAEREWRSKVCFEPLEKSGRARLGIGEHDRAEAYILANGKFPLSDGKAHHTHFPISVKNIHAECLFVGPGEVLDLSVRPEEFPWDTRDAELYLHLSVKQLILSQQSRLVVNGNVFILKCEQLIANDLQGGTAVISLGASDAIQQTSFSQGCAREPWRLKGEDGVNGEDAAALEIESTPLGVRVTNKVSASEGKAGTDGMNGLNGENGRNGSMLFLTDLRFSQLKDFPPGSIHIRAQAGEGFPGMDGGDGGGGGHGGKGTEGIVTPFGVYRGHPGGKGGRGGEGGTGGNGGKGGICCDILLSVPEDSARIFRVISLPSSGGKGGLGGIGGQGGRPGSNGYLSPSAPLPEANNGNNGRVGNEGRCRPGPQCHIFECNPESVTF